MKTRYILPALLVLGTTAASTQAMAGLTYDSEESYFSQFYEDGEGSPIVQTKSQENTMFSGVCSDYYNSYYTRDNPTVNRQQIVSATATDAMDIADPRNFYMW